MKKHLFKLLGGVIMLFTMSISVNAAEKTTSPYTGITIEQAAGRTDLYLYNVESGYWLQENNRQRGSWNTRGNLDAHGFDVAITAIDGGYQINPKFGHNNSMNGSNWYLDTGDAVTAWTFSSITKEGVSNAYQIKYGDNWLHATPEGEGFMLICNNVEARATWQIVTRAERLSYLQNNATVNNPLDATFLINGFDLANEDSRMSSWVEANDGGSSDWNRADDGDNGYRCLRAHGYWNSKTYSYTQTIANVPDGVYEFYCTGFYRDGDRDQCQERRNAGTETIRGFMFLNDKEAPLKSILDGAQSSSGNGFGYHNENYNYGYFPDGGDDVTRAFVSMPNAYLNEPVRAIVAGGTITLGIRKKEYTGGSDWVFFSRFRLRYLGLVPVAWNGTDDAILPSIKYGGSYSAYTKLFNADYDYGGGEANNEHFNKIVGTPANDGSNNAWYAENYSMTDWSYGQFHTDFGNGRPADIYVRRYFVVNNDLPETVYMPAPHDDAPCEYYINGTLVWSRTGTEPGVNGWEENEVVRLTDEQKALIKTDGTVNVFAFHVHQNWGGRYADGGLYGDANTDDTPSKKFRDDTNRSRLENVFNTFSVEDLTTWSGISSETANKAKAACNYLQDASYYFDQLFPAALNTRINTANAIVALNKMSTAGTNALNGVISTASNTNDKDSYVSALTALNTAINAAVIDLKQNQAEKSAQPTIFTMVSESVVGTDDNNYGTIVNDHADGFYVYNVGTGRWFCGGDEWGAHAAVGFPGIKVTTPKNDYGSGHYNSVVTWLFNGNWGSSGQLNHGGFCDTGGNGWKFWKQNAAQGIYTWSRNGSDSGDNNDNGYGTKDLVGFAPSTYARVNTDRTGADDPYNQWIFVTEAQRDEMAAAAMATASESNPVDLTYKIKMPGFNQRERKEGTNQDSEELDWTCNHANYRYSDGRLLIMGRNDNHSDFVCDVYGYSWNDAFSLTQTVTGLTPGRYRVKVQGYNNGGSDTNKACLVANGEKVALVERSSETVLPWTSKLPENTFDNPEYFQAGCYWNEVLCVVGNNGELTLGVESPSVTGGHVIIFDNFRLEYVGIDRITLDDTNENVADIPASSDIAIVTVTRAFNKGWNAVCLPFDVAADDPLLAGDSEVAELESCTSDGNGNVTLHFNTVTTGMKANTPYLLYLPAAVDAGSEFEAVSFQPSTVKTECEFFDFMGTYVKAPVVEVGDYVISDGQLKKATATITLKGTRTYFKAKDSSVRSARITFDDDTTTGITEMVNGKSVNGKYYDLQGRQIVNGKLQRGLYIQKGKKVIK